jgi:hypothetical protein
MPSNKPKPFRTVSADQKKSPFERAMVGKRRRGVDWAKVDVDTLRYAAAAVVTCNATLVLSSAMGGVGATIRVWAGDDKWVEYANSAEELNDWLEAVGDHYASGSEDLRMILGMGTGLPDTDSQAEAD